MTRFIPIVIMLCAVAVPSLLGAAAPTHPVVASPDQPDLKWVTCGSGMPEGCEVAVLHGNPKIGPSEVFVRMPQGYRFPAHWHTANERITMVKGTMSLTVTGGEVINARPGTYLFLPGKTSHSGQCGETEACVLSVALDKPLDIHAAGAKHR